MALIKNPLGLVASIVASDEIILGDIVCKDMDTFTATLRATFNALATGDARVLLYFSPDGQNYDSTFFAKFDLSVSPGKSVQKTGIFDFPQFGYMRVSVKNLDTAKSITDVSVFTTEKRFIRNKILDAIKKGVYGAETK